jgi:cation transport regulator ChaC
MIPSDRFLYFAYGSNMLSRRLQQRTPSAIAIDTGYVEGRSLVFHKLGRDASGKCDMKATDAGTDRVYGVLFRVRRAEKPALDHAEGLGTGYAEESVPVHLRNRKTVDAITYAAIAIEPNVLPFDWYRALVIAGALEHGLPASHIDWIRSFHSQPDADIERRAKNMYLLSRCT